MKKKTTQYIIRILLLVGTLYSLTFVPWPIVKAWLPPLRDTVQDEVNEATAFGFEGSIVYVDIAGKAPAFYTSGWHDSEKRIPAYPQALFKIASISKLYRALAITKLVAAGRLSLNKSLADYFPELKGRIAYAESITLRMMVQHRSGIPNYTDVEGYWVNPPDTREATLELVLDQPAYFEPDTDYGYSNTNYLLLELLMDKTLGYEHWDYIKDEILIPLELKHTYASLGEVDVDSVMSGYYVGYEPDLRDVEQGMLATAEDVGSFVRALNDGSAFNGDEQTIYSSIYVYNHTGLVPGYQSIAKYHPELDAVVVQFTNTTDFSGYNWNLSELMYGRIVKILKAQESN